MAKEEAAGVGPAAGQNAAEAAFAEPKQRKSKKGLLLFVVIPLLLLLLAGGGAGYYFFFMVKKEEVHAEPPPPPPKPAVYYNLPEFLVNLASRTGRMSFLKITVSLELEDAADVSRVQAVMPRVVNNVQAFLRELRPEDLKGTANLNRLRQEMLARVNEAAQPTKANNVLFLEVLLQ